MRPRVSIIVPIYNMEAYLERCLESLVSQRLREMEIIAVNDGSTDRSGEMLRAFAERDPRLKVIEQPNSGVSAARNRGIAAAQGEYIGFVDPDDWVDAEMYEQMYLEALLEDADIVMCTYVREFGTHSKEKVFPFPEKTRYEGEAVKQIVRRLVGPVAEEMANPEYIDAWGTVWSKLYRAELIQEHRLAFVDLSRIGTSEDTLFNIQAVYYAETFLFLNRCYYHYWRANAESITTGYKPYLMDQWFVLYSLISSFLQEKELPEEYHLALQNRICLNTLGLGLNTISQGNPKSIVGKMKELSGILNDRRIRESFAAFQIRHCSAVWRAFFGLAKHRVSLGYLLLLYAIEGLRKVKR